MLVRFVDLKEQYNIIKEEINKSITGVLESCQFILGPETTAFEEEFAKYCGTDFCVGVSNGTDALKFSLIALGIKPGDEIITTSNTFIATAEAISQIGAEPVFVDIDPKTYNINTEQLSGVINSKTKAIIPVHLYGQCANMEVILDLAKNYDLKVVEDACQAHGSVYKGKRAGSFGDVAAFSFYPGKNLGAYGEGGAITTNQSEIYAKIRMLRDHGQESKYNHAIEGYNGRLDSIQASILRVKLRHLDKWNSQRQRLSRLYNLYLAEVNDMSVPFISEHCEHIFHLYVVRIKDRDKLRKFLAEKDIETGIHYPVPIHLQKAYAYLGYKKGTFPVTEKITEEILSLPMYPELTEDAVEYVAKMIKGYYC